MSVLEAGMIICFGISWPVAILKTLKTRSVFFNFSMVFVEICLWFRYHGRPLSIAAAARRSEAYGAADTLLGDPVDVLQAERG